MTTKRPAGMRSPILDLPTQSLPKGGFKNGLLLGLNNLDILYFTGQAFAYQYFVEALIKKPVVADFPSRDIDRWNLQSLVFSMREQSVYKTLYQSLSQYADHTRIKKTDEGFLVSYPIAKNFDLSLITNRLSDTQAITGGPTVQFLEKEALGNYPNYNEKIRFHRTFTYTYENNLLELVGDDLLYAERMVSYRIPASEVLKETPIVNQKAITNQWTFLYGAKNLGNIPSAYEILSNAVHGFRLVGTPTSGRANLEVYEAIGGQTIRIKTIEEALAIKEQYPILFQKFLHNLINTRKWTIMADMKLTAQEAAIICNAVDPSTVTEVDISDWIAQWVHYIPSKDNSWQIQRLVDIRNNNKRLIEAGIPCKPRAKNGLTVHPEGYLIYVPELDNLDQHGQLILANVDTVDGEFTLANLRQEDLRWHEAAMTPEQFALLNLNHVPANRFLLTDWYNNKLSYTNTSGVQDVLDLERCMPLTATHVNKFFKTKVHSVKEGNKKSENLVKSLAYACLLFANSGADLISEYNKGGDDLRGIVTAWRADHFLKLIKQGQLTEALNELWEILRSSSLGYNLLTGEEFVTRYPEIGKLQEFTFGDMSPTGLPFLRGIGYVLQAACDFAITQFTDVLEQRSVMQSLKDYGVIKVVAEYMSKTDEVAEQDAELRRMYTGQ